MSQIEATLLGVAVAALALMLGLLTYVLSRSLLPLAPSGKLWDRVYELDKLVLSYPELFARFMAEVHRTSPYFYADPSVVPRTKDFYQLKALVYFHLNVFEEIFLTTSRSGWIARQFEQEGWDEYIFRKMRHPLLREVFDREAKQIYPGKFRDFVQRNHHQIEETPDPNAF
ncbi:hypothetical protein [Polaromonas sp. C04]|uniref:hypothetical protein n=1 Tax=Polaromonas sp. C04 TaxID=1945857 RepID=UPI000984B7DD|nr:hypothetical protein [Polaromonas sp. C04]OOG51786.1 hypothetical protein B0E49_14255 [Polaromonas sp. C04]